MKNIWVKIGGHWFQAMDAYFKVSPSFDEEDADLSGLDEIEAISSVYRSNDDTCLHEHLTCPGDINTLRCAYCNKSMTQKNSIAQECYLECLAVECGEGECAKAIAEKFPELVSRLDEENRLEQQYSERIVADFEKNKSYSQKLLNAGGDVIEYAHHKGKLEAYQEYMQKGKNLRKPVQRKERENK